MGVHQLSYPRGCLKRLMVESPKKNKKKHDPVLRDRHSRMENGGWSLKPQTKHGMFFCSKDTNTFFVCVSLWGWDILNQLAPQTTTLAMGISLVNNCVGKPPPWLPYICLAIWGSRIQTSWIYACRDSDFMRVNTVFIRIIRTQQKNLMFSVPSRKYRGKHERTIESYNYRLNDWLNEFDQAWHKSFYMSTVSEMANPNWRTYFGYVWIIFGWVSFHRQHTVGSRFHHAESLKFDGMDGSWDARSILSGSVSFARRCKGF